MFMSNGERFGVIRGTECSIASLQNDLESINLEYGFTWIFMKDKAHFEMRREQRERSERKWKKD